MRYCVFSSEISTCEFLCLVLSIHTYAESSMKARPVRASIHGGCLSVLLLRIFCFYRLQPQFNLEKERSFDKLQWIKASSHSDTKSKAKRCERREAEKSAITYSVVCSKNEGDPLGTSKVRIKNDHQSEDLVEVVADLKHQLLLSKF